MGSTMGNSVVRGSALTYPEHDFSASFFRFLVNVLEMNPNGVPLEELVEAVSEDVGGIVAAALDVWVRF